LLSKAPKTGRYRFQFGLGTLLLLITVFAAFLAYHVNWIRERHAIVNSASDPKVLSYSFDPQDPFGDVAPRSAPGLLGLFSEEGYHDIVIFFPFGVNGDSRRRHNREQLTPAELAEVRRVQLIFPEAAVRGVAVEGR
jgi:hypothetical protein